MYDGITMTWSVKVRRIRKFHIDPTLQILDAVFAIQVTTRYDAIQISATNQHCHFVRVLKLSNSKFLEKILQMCILKKNEEEESSGQKREVFNFDLEANLTLWAEVRTAILV